MALRVGNWKCTFMEQRGHGLAVWEEPLVAKRVPDIYNLRSDPFERASEDASLFYGKWKADRAFLLVPGAGDRRGVPQDVQGLPAAAAAGQLQHRPGAREGAAGPGDHGHERWRWREVALRRHEDGRRSSGVGRLRFASAVSDNDERHRGTCPSDMSADPISEFYTRHPYPPPVANLDRARDEWRDPNRHRAEYHLLWPARPYRADSRHPRRRVRNLAGRQVRALPTPMRGSSASTSAPPASSTHEKLKQQYDLTNLETPAIADRTGQRAGAPVRSDRLHGRASSSC